MDGETDFHHNLDAETLRMVPVCELLDEAGKVFDDLADKFRETHDAKFLRAKQQLIADVAGICEKHGIDFEEYSQKIRSSLASLSVEMAESDKMGMFIMWTARVGYAHGTKDNNVNIFYTLATECSSKNN